MDDETRQMINSLAATLKQRGLAANLDEAVLTAKDIVLGHGWRNDPRYNESLTGGKDKVQQENDSGVGLTDKPFFEQGNEISTRKCVAAPEPPERIDIRAMTLDQLAELEDQMNEVIADETIVNIAQKSVDDASASAVDEAPLGTAQHEPGIVGAERERCGADGPKLMPEASSGDSVCDDECEDECDVAEDLENTSSKAECDKLICAGRDDDHDLEPYAVSGPVSGHGCESGEGSAADPGMVSQDEPNLGAEPESDEEACDCEDCIEPGLCGLKSPEDAAVRISYGFVAPSLDQDSESCAHHGHDYAHSHDAIYGHGSIDEVNDPDDFIGHSCGCASDFAAAHDCGDCIYPQRDGPAGDDCGAALDEGADATDPQKVCGADRESIDPSCEGSYDDDEDSVYEVPSLKDMTSYKNPDGEEFYDDDLCIEDKELSEGLYSL